mgnify:CR=1 FL=1
MSEHAHHLVRVGGFIHGDSELVESGSGVSVGVGENR